MTLFAQAWNVWPQLVDLFIGVLTVIINIWKNGEPMTKPEFNAMRALTAVMFSWFLLYKGGFFIPLGVSP